MADFQYDVPPVKEEWLREAKATFPKYMFYERNGKREVSWWCSACEQSGTVKPLQRTMTPADRRMLSLRSGESVECPLCGETCTAKCKGLLKSGLSVDTYRCFAFFCLKSPQELWIRCYYICRYWYTDSKEYSWNLREAQRYRLTLGNAEHWRYSSYFGSFGQTENNIIAPFGRNSGGGFIYEPYTVLGDKDLTGTFLRYHSYSIYRDNRYADYVKYLCCYAVYPLFEQLLKAGYADIVDDALRGSYNKSVLDLSAPSLKAAWKIPIEVVRRWRETKHRCTAVLRTYAQYYRKLGVKGYDKALRRWEVCHTYGLHNDVFEMTKYGMQTESIIEYLYRCNKRTGDTLTHCAILYKDYLRFAKETDALTGDEIVRFPPHLQAAHDRAYETYTALQAEREREKAAAEKRVMMRRFDELTALYAYSDGNYMIAIPQTTLDIVREGKELRHCVGGYANRHLNGDTNIIFIRRVSEPEKPYYTVEIRGDKIIQCYGYRDCIVSEQTLKDFINAFIRHTTAVLKKRKRNKEKKTA